MWIKFVLCICIVAFTTVLGYLLAGKWRMRKNFFAQSCLFHERYLNELDYARKPLGDFLAEYTYSGDFEKTVREFSQNKTIALKYAYLTKEEKKSMEIYFSMLGKGDAHSQKGYFSAQTAPLREKREECNKEAKRRSDLYVKLGLLAGLAAVILII